MLSKEQIVDRTLKVHAGNMPKSVQEGKQAVLAALSNQTMAVKSVEFLENFNVSPVETAIAELLGTRVSSCR